ncbi:MAG: hypothetical protein ABUS79_25525 [Pseudomonadota bacterium]
MTMSSLEETAARVLREVENAFGYPVADEELRTQLLSTWESDVEDDLAFEEIFGLFISSSIAWTAEGHAGPNPERAANAASRARLGDDDDDTDDEEVTPETPELVARHFSGLLTIESVPMPRPRRDWLADLNATGRAPVYLWFDGPFPEGAIFSSEAERQVVRKLIRGLQKAAAVEDEAALNKLATELRDKHPRAFAVEQAALIKKDALPPAFRKPPPDAELTDAAGARLWRAYRAFLPAGRVLIQRAAGQRGAKLTAAEAKAPGQVAAADAAWAPAILSGLVAPALSGDMAAASKAAEAIVTSDAGVPLTRRWAKLVAAGEGPFAR